MKKGLVFITLISLLIQGAAPAFADDDDDDDDDDHHRPRHGHSHDDDDDDKKKGKNSNKGNSTSIVINQSMNSQYGAQSDEPGNGQGNLNRSLSGDSDDSEEPSGIDGTYFGQGQSIGAAIQLNSTSASRSASLGAVKCAHGANESLAVEGGGGEAISECQAYFRAANTMAEHEKKLGGSGSLQPDAAVLGQPSSNEVLSKFEKNFEMDRREYLGRMMSGSSSRSVLGDILSSRIPEDSVAATFANADALAEDAAAKVAGASELNVYQIEGSKLAAKGKGTAANSLREKLSSRLDADSRASTGRSLASTATPGRRPQAEAKADQPITPLDPKAAFGLSSTKEAVEELSIFDVIRLKYKEVATKFR